MPPVTGGCRKRPYSYLEDSESDEELVTSPVSRSERPYSEQEEPESDREPIQFEDETSLVDTITRLGYDSLPDSADVVIFDRIAGQNKSSNNPTSGMSLGINIININIIIYIIIYILYYL